METITFETLPKAISDLHRKIDMMLAQSRPNAEIKEQDKLFTIELLIDYLPEHPARQTVYGWVNLRQIPFEKYGKRLYFRKSRIDIWLSNGRRTK
jgi:hypothetical protein